MGIRTDVRPLSVPFPGMPPETDRAATKPSAVPTTPEEGTMTTTLHPDRRATHRTVADVMSRNPTTVGPTDTYKACVVRLLSHHVSALPVVDDTGRLVGVVSEADLLAKERHAEEPFLGALRPAWRAERSRAESTFVRDLMTSPAITVLSRANLSVAARTMARRKIRRLCVVDDAGCLIGIVTRGDLLRPFARDDAELGEDIRTAVIFEVMCLDPRDFAVSVHDGVAQISGVVDRRTDVEILERLVRHVDGIVDVRVDLTWGVDDRHFKVGQLPPFV